MTNLRLVHKAGTTHERVVREVAGYRGGLLPCALVYFHGSLVEQYIPTDELEVVNP